MEKIEITVIVNGFENKVTAIADEPLFEVVGKVNHETGQKRLRYEYRNAQGILLEPWRSVGQLVRFFNCGTRFFVNPPVGFGG